MYGFYNIFIFREFYLFGNNICFEKTTWVPFIQHLYTNLSDCYYVRKLNVNENFLYDMI